MEEQAYFTSLTYDQIYIRFIGDRRIPEMDFGNILKDRRKEMLKYVKRVKESENENSNTILLNSSYQRPHLF